MRQRPISAHTHTLVRTVEPLLINRGPDLLLPLPPIMRSSLRTLDRPTGSAEEFEEVFLKAPKAVLMFTWVRGFVLVYASLVKGPHRNGAFYFVIRSSVRRRR